MQEGLHLQTVNSLLETYLHGLSGRELKITAGDESYTDTDTIFLPPVLNRFNEPENNFLLYKLMTVFHWARIVKGSLLLDESTLRFFLNNACSKDSDIAELFLFFPEQALAKDLYTLLDSFRIKTFLHKELAGLMREADMIKEKLFPERPDPRTLSEKTSFVESLYQYFLGGQIKADMPSPLKAVIPLIQDISEAHGPLQPLRLLSELYAKTARLEGSYAGTPFDYLGTINPESVSLRLQMRRAKRKKRIENIISKISTLPDIEVEPFLQKMVGLPPPPVHGMRKKDAAYLLLRGKLFEMNEEYKDIIHEAGIFSDGILLDGHSAQEGRIIISLKNFDNEEDIEQHNGGIKYDEWDFRRGDYKKAWCSLFEQDISPGDEPFVDLTLRRYGGYVTTLRRKFELLKKELKILRRQQEGDGLDIDAVVEAFADSRAGLSPSQNLFTRLDREERNIAALFLLDMSGSTKGWVNRAEKEALILMCEALEALGDRYAIFGFSGMTKNKCEYFRIKGFDERYGTTVKRRISGILPKDYTRMGPPIRHSARILKEVDAKVKLLITLSDGHPEDRDGYHGDYGIEDTRKALIEAKENGIKPFCITIDQEARSYLPHMFGEVGYIVLDDVRRLPNKITEIYRKLTT